MLAPSDDHKVSHRDDDLLYDPSMGGGSHADINSALGHWADSDTAGVCRVQPPQAGPTHDAHDVEQAAKDPKVAKRLDVDWFDQGMDDGYLGSVEKEFGAKGARDRARSSKAMKAYDATMKAGKEAELHALMQAKKISRAKALKDPAYLSYSQSLDSSR